MNIAFIGIRERRELFGQKLHPKMVRQVDFLEMENL
jgi:hypothetical protein